MAPLPGRLGHGPDDDHLDDLVEHDLDDGGHNDHHHDAHHDRTLDDNIDADLHVDHLDHRPVAVPIERERVAASA